MSRVIAMDASPIASCTTLGCTPSRNASVANVHGQLLHGSLERRPLQSPLTSTLDGHMSNIEIFPTMTIP